MIGKWRIVGRGEEDVVGEQRQLLAIRFADAVVECDEDGVQFHVLQPVSYTHLYQLALGATQKTYLKINQMSLFSLL